MKKHSVLIVDDDIENANLLKIYIEKYSRYIERIHIALSVKEAINSYLEHYQDILLLDVKLKNDTNSFNIIEAIPYTKAEIIVVSSYKEYAIEAINSFNISGYLLKPIIVAELIAALDKAIKKIESKSIKESELGNVKSKCSELIAIPSTNKIDLVKEDDIIYIEANGRYSIFHLSNGEHKIASRNLGEYERLLNSLYFFRIHHSYLINLKKTIKINKFSGNYCELQNGKLLPIAKRRQEELNRFLKIK